MAILLVAALFALPANAAEKTEVVEQKIPFVQGGTLILKTGNASLRVLGWDSTKIALKILKRARGNSFARAKQALQAVQVTTRKEKNRFLLTARLPQGNFNLLDVFTSRFWKQKFQRVTVRLELQVPARSNLKIRGEDKNISVRGVSGEIQITLDDGNLHVQNCASPLFVIEGSSGKIEIENVTGGKKNSLIFSTGRGDVFIRGGNFLKLVGQTESGDVILLHPKVQTLDISTKSGTVEAMLNPLSTPVWRVNSRLGDILFQLPPGLPAKLKIKTEEGTIFSDSRFPVRKNDAGAFCETTLGAGAGQIELHTHEGDIHLPLGTESNTLF